jgi:membrane fusion protein, copper/silver efflux system
MSSFSGRVRAGWRVLQVRLRFPIILLVVFLVVGKWDLVRNYWHWVLRGFSHNDTLRAVAVDTEYFCPMCPGVISDWPSKCPVCNMALVRRQRGDATPSADGSIPRMQFSPYRMQLAGIQTAPVAFRQLSFDVELSGTLQTTASGKLTLQSAVSQKDLQLLCDGLRVKVQHAGDREPVSHEGRLHLQKSAGQAQIEIDDPRGDLHAGEFVVARVQIPAHRLASARWALCESWRDHTLVEGAVRNALACSGLTAERGLDSLFQSACSLALLERGWILAIPESAVVDTGDRHLTYIQIGPGMFEARELALGFRCGEYFPVLHGAAAGQPVAAAGAFLIDAETRLNPSLAAAYFGASRNQAEPVQDRIQKQPPVSDDEAIALQEKCPVTDEPLGSMGPPVRVSIDGRVVFLCCRGCESTLRKEPGKYLAKLKKP